MRNHGENISWFLKSHEAVFSATRPMSDVRGGQPELLGAQHQRGFDDHFIGQASARPGPGRRSLGQSETNDEALVLDESD